jgi:histone H3/H4
MEFTLQPLRRIFRRAGAKRVSDKAAEELGRVLEGRAKLLLAESKRLSEHAGRRTVMRDDVKMAKKHGKK